MNDVFKMMIFVFKMLNDVFKMMIFVFKMLNYVFKMMIYALKTRWMLIMQTHRHDCSLTPTENGRGSCARIMMCLGLFGKENGLK